MKQVTVTWSTNLFNVGTPLQAAKEALSHIIDENSLSHVFIVTDDETGENWSVDLDVEEENYYSVLEIK